MTARTEVVPGVRGDVPPAAWQWFRANYGRAWLALRESPPFDAYPPSGWAVFTAVAAGWVRDDAPLATDTVVKLSGVSRATVFRVLEGLQRTGVLQRVGQVGHGVGPRLSRVLTTLAFSPSDEPGAATPSRHKRETVPLLGSGRSESPESHVGDSEVAPSPASSPDCYKRETYSVVDSGVVDSHFDEGSPVVRSRKSHFETQPESITLLMNKNKILRSSSSLPIKGTRIADAPPSGGPSPRTLACDALATLFGRANPGEPLPTSFRVDDVDLIVACMAPGTWGPAEQAQMHLDAIEGAFRTTRFDVPTPRYIWANLDLFLRHVRAGRAARAQAAKPAAAPAAPRPPEDPPVSLADTAVFAGNLVAILDSIPDHPKRTYRTFPTKDEP